MQLIFGREKSTCFLFSDASNFEHCYLLQEKGNNGGKRNPGLESFQFEVMDRLVQSLNC